MTREVSGRTLSENGSFGTKKYPIEQILFGYIDEGRRPEEINVLSDGQGVVYVPRVGYFNTDLPNWVLTLSWCASSRRYLLGDNGTTIAYQFEDIPMIADGGIEVVRRDHPLLSRTLCGRACRGCGLRPVGNCAYPACEPENLARVYEALAPALLPDCFNGYKKGHHL